MRDGSQTGSSTQLRTHIYIQEIISLISHVCSDFKESKAFMSNIQYAVFGLGDSLYGGNFNKAAFTVDQYLQMMKLGAMTEIWIFFS